MCAHALAESPRSGGTATTGIHDTSAFSLPAPSLPVTRRGDFFAGNSFFKNPWVPAPASTTARDGLGPLFNTNTCQSCHLKDGRGRPPEPGETMTSMLVRVSVPGPSEPGAIETRRGVTPDAVYGDQLQNRANPGVAPEARIDVTWETMHGRFADGSEYTLQKPRLRVSELGYGALRSDAMLSPRVAPALIGLGLLEAVPEAQIQRRVDPDDADRDGISGRANYVWDESRGARALGRFGWKAGQPKLRQQVAAAFAGDLGLTTSLFPEQPCTASQSACARGPHGGAPEVDDRILDLVTFYVRALGVPARRKTQLTAVQRGEALFRSAGCTSCHVESMRTGKSETFPWFANQEIHAYTDLLLHDMGEGLADGRPEFQATGREWRTPPLWGIGLIPIVSRHTRYLHDGRARNLQEAILWHGGEAEKSRRFFESLDATQRDELLFFLDNL